MPPTEKGCLHIKRYHTKHADKRDIEEIITYCKSIFNSAVGEDFLNDQNLKVEFFNLENGIIMYERFCQQYFPSYLTKYHDNYTEPGYMASFLAQAFVNGDIYGILCSLDAMIDPNCWYETILHEMTHIYCKKRESNGEDFFQKYCVDEEKGTGVSGEMAAGYAVWSEFIAYYLGAELDPFSNPLSMSQVRKEIRELDVDVDGTNPEAKMIVSQMLAHIFRNPEICNTENVAAAMKIIEKNEIFESMEQANSFQSLIEIIFEQLHKKACWEITPSFIDDVGSAYLMIVGTSLYKVTGIIEHVVCSLAKSKT